MRCTAQSPPAPQSGCRWTIERHRFSSRLRICLRAAGDNGCQVPSGDFVAFAVTAQVGRNGRRQFRLKTLLTIGDVIHVPDIVLYAKKANLAQRLFLGAEIVIKASLFDSQALGDVLGAGAVKAFFRKHSGSSANSRLPLPSVLFRVRRLHVPKFYRSIE